MLGCYLSKRWVGLDQAQLERIAYVAGSAALAQSQSCLVKYPGMVKDLLTQYANMRLSRLLRLPQFAGLKDAKAILHADSECAYVWEMASYRLDHVHLECKTMWNQEQLKDTLYRALVTSIPELKHTSPVEYAKTLRWLGSSVKRQAEADEESLKSLRYYASRQGARGISRTSASNFIEALRPTSLAKGDLANGVTAGRALSNALFDFMLHVKNRLDLRQIGMELEARLVGLSAQMSFDPPQAFTNPVLRSLVPKTFKPKGRSETYQMLAKLIKEEYSHDMARAKHYMQSPERESELQGLVTEIGSLSEPAQIQVSDAPKEPVPALGSLRFAKNLVFSPLRITPAGAR